MPLVCKSATPWTLSRCTAVAIFEEFRGDDRSDCQWTGLTGLGLQMPRNEEIGFQLTLTDGGK